MRLVEQWGEIERSLPEGWGEARLALAVEDADADRAAALLGPLNPGRGREAIRFPVRRGGGPAAPEGVRRLLGRLDRERIAGTLELTEAVEAVAPPAAPAEAARTTLADAWDAAVASLPPDWSDLLARASFRASDQIDRAALLMSPLNPVHPPGEPDASALQFRSARRFGYGASAGMARRCLERCDADGIHGTVAVLWALSDTQPVSTQGPVWYVGGRTA